MGFGFKKEEKKEKTEMEKTCQLVAEIIYPGENEKKEDDQSLDYITLCNMDLNDIAIVFEYYLIKENKSENEEKNFNSAFLSFCKLANPFGTMVDAKFEGLKIILKHVMKEAQTVNSAKTFLENSPKVKELLRVIFFNEERVPVAFESSKSQDPSYMKDFMTKQRKKMDYEIKALAQAINLASLTLRPQPAPPSKKP